MLAAIIYFFESFSMGREGSCLKCSKCEPLIGAKITHTKRWEALSKAHRSRQWTQSLRWAGRPHRGLGEDRAVRERRDPLHFLWLMRAWASHAAMSSFTAASLRICDKGPTFLATSEFPPQVPGGLAIFHSWEVSGLYNKSSHIPLSFSWL